MFVQEGRLHSGQLTGHRPNNFFSVLGAFDTVSDSKSLFEIFKPFRHQTLETHHVVDLSLLFLLIQKIYSLKNASEYTCDFFDHSIRNPQDAVDFEWAAKLDSFDCMEVIEALWY